MFHVIPEPAISATKPLKIKFVMRPSKGLVERVLTKTNPEKINRKSRLASNVGQFSKLSVSKEQGFLVWVFFESPKSYHYANE